MDIKESIQMFNTIKDSGTKNANELPSRKKTQNLFDIKSAVSTFFP